MSTSNDAPRALSPTPLRGGLCLSLASSPTLYALIRVLSAALGPEQDPSAASSSSASATFDRLTITLYSTVLALPGAVALLRAHPALFDRALVAFAALSTLAICAQATFVP